MANFGVLEVPDKLVEHLDELENIPEEPVVGGGEDLHDVGELNEVVLVLDQQVVPLVD